MKLGRPLKRLADLVSGSGFPLAFQGDPGNELPFLKVGDLGRITPRGHFLPPADTIDRQLAIALGARVIPPHTPVMAKIGAAVSLRRVGITATDSCIDNNMFAAIPRAGTNPRFLYYALHLLDPALLLNGGAVPNLNMGWTGATKLPGIAMSSQRLIADYLDHETAEIDAFISDLEQMREWLEERWRGALVELVQGRRLGDLVATDLCVWPTAPSSWLRTRLKATVADASNGSWGDEAGDSTGVRCIRVADFDKIRGTVHNMNPTSRQYDSPTLHRLGLNHGDLLIEKSGGGPTSPVGNVVRYTGEGGEMYSNFVARIRVPPHIDSEYALRLHQSLYVGGVTARSVKQATGIQNLDETAYFNEPVFLPDLEQQKRIAALLSTQRTSTDVEIADVDAAIALAKERRAALITAAVTGQIDVTAPQKPVIDSIQTAIEEAR